MTDDPVELDERRGMAAQKATEIRRRLNEAQVTETAARERRAVFEASLIAMPATSWPEAAAKARYLIQLFAATPEAQNSRHQALIASVLADFTQLSD